MKGEDAYKEDYEHIELFDELGLFTNSRIDRETVPAGWYCYDLRGSDDDPGDPTTVEEQVTSNHAGTVLLPKALKLNRVDIDGTRYRKIGEGLNFLDGEVTLEEFCKEHGLAFPERKPRYELKPMSADEFKRLGSNDETTIPYAIGHVRIDFGRNGKEFWHTWWPENEDKFNTPAFKTALQEFINDLRAVGPLRDRRTMEKYCSEHMAGKQNTSLGDMYAYTVETERYLTAVYLDGEYKVAQFGAQDGYPRIGGAEVLRFAKTIVESAAREAFEQKVRQCRWITAEELGSIDKSKEADWEKDHPELADSTGAGILEMIRNSESGLVLGDDLDFAADSLFCEWAWVLDLDKGTFECYQGSNAEIPLTEQDRFYFLRDKEEHGYYGVRLAKAWELKHLPDEKTFLNQLENLRPERKTGDTVRFITQRIKKKTERGESR